MGKATDIQIIILAAGKGTRMRGDKPKALRMLGGKPLLAHILETLETVGDLPPPCVVIHSDMKDEIDTHINEWFGDARPEIKWPEIKWCLQKKPLGTGDAVRCAMEDVADDARVVVLYADVPLIRAETIKQLADTLDNSAMTILTMHIEKPFGYGRIKRSDDGNVLGIVEQSDLAQGDEAIREVNTGVLAGRAEVLKAMLAKVDCKNAQGEYYLTDCVALAIEANNEVRAIVLNDATEAMGVNTNAELCRAERQFYRRRADALIEKGVYVRDPDRLDIRGELEVGDDVEIDIGVIFEGTVRLGKGVRIGAHCVLKDVDVGDASEIKPMTLIEGARIGRDCRVGPFARIRPDTTLDDGVGIGNYVEVKKSRVGKDSKAGHLSYIGDSTVGAGVNVGAGVITCNYDGESKHATQVGDRVFIGSGTQLVAPLTIGDDATIGAGSTLTRDAPAGALTLSRTPQKTHETWKRRGRESEE